MGAHAGVFFFDMRPTMEQRRVLAAALEPLAPDGVSVIDEDGVAMAHSAFHVWCGEGLPRQPLTSPSGLVATWDGRLDNREDLSLQLQAMASASDGAIALAAFERWGVDGLRSLVGEWTLAIWDRPRRTLHLARDCMGVRPLYYCASNREVMWSCSLGELAVRSGRVHSLSDAFAAGFMALRVPSGITPYDGVLDVPAATCLSFSSSVHTRRRFWTFAPGNVRYRDSRCYDEHLRALWSDAVRSRLRTENTVWAELSGGLDSSSIVCMADALVKAGRVEASAVQPMSYVTLQSVEGDERRFIADIESRLGVRSEVLGIERHQDVTDPDCDWVTPYAAWGVALAGLQRVRERGGRVVLSGRVGDAVMGCQPDNSVAVLDDFDDGAWLTALANMRRWSRSCRKPFVEIACSVALARFGRRRRQPGPREQAGIALLAPRLGAMVSDDPTLDLSTIRPSKRELAASLLAYPSGSQLNIPLLPPGVIFTYPYTHRPLIEYVAAIPGNELSAPGQSRALMRRAFDGLVPPRVLRRVSKGYYPPSAMRSLRVPAAALRPVERLEVVQRGWIDPHQLDAAIGGLLDGGCTGGEVRRVLRLQHWLTSRHRRGPAGIPQREEVNAHAVLNA
jgi:asparagine synthase (glutamine-hydrolysing)